MVKKEFYQNLENFINGLDNKRDEIKILNFVMEEIGYIPLEVQEFIAYKTGLFLVTIQNAIEFFPRYKAEVTETVEIKVCNGMGCSGRGNLMFLEEIKKLLGIEVGETTKDGRYKLSTQRCFGKCSKGPNISKGGVIFSNVKMGHLKDFLK